MSKAKGEKDLTISLLMEKGRRTLPAEMIKEMISDGIAGLLFDKLLPAAFYRQCRAHRRRDFSQGTEFCSQPFAERNDSVG